MKRFGIYLTEVQLEALGKRAEETGFGISEIIRSIIQDWVDDGNSSRK